MEPIQFGSYRLLQHLASGGMAEIFLAEPLATGSPRERLVVKRIRTEHLGRADFRGMFLEEGRLNAAIQHRNVVRVLDRGEVDGVPFIGLEFVDGLDLRDLLHAVTAQGSKLPLPLGVHIVREVALGLHAAHEAVDEEGRRLQLVHRDVCPHNILLGYDGRVRIGDFGIAHGRDALPANRPGQLTGRVGYLSPEQCAGLDLDHRSDIFSLGIVLYEATLGRRLFKGPSRIETQQMIKEARVTAPRALVEDYPPDLERILLRALAREPEGRYPSAEALARELSLFLTLSSEEVEEPALGRYLQTVAATRSAGDTWGAPAAARSTSDGWSLPGKGAPSEAGDEEPVTPLSAADQPVPVAVAPQVVGSGVAEPAVLDATPPTAGVAGPPEVSAAAAAPPVVATPRASAPAPASSVVAAPAPVVEPVAVAAPAPVVEPVAVAAPAPVVGPSLGAASPLATARTPAAVGAAPAAAPPATTPAAGARRGPASREATAPVSAPRPGGPGAAPQPAGPLKTPPPEQPAASTPPTPASAPPAKPAPLPVQRPVAVSHAIPVLPDGGAEELYYQMHMDPELQGKRLQRPLRILGILLLVAIAGYFAWRAATRPRPVPVVPTVAETPPLVPAVVAPDATAEVRATPTGAWLTVDLARPAVLLPAAPVSVLAGRSHTLHLQLPGHHTYQARIFVEESGARHVEDVTLRPLEPEAVPGRVLFDVTPSGFTVSQGGALLGKTAGPYVLPGGEEHVLSIQKEGYITSNVLVSIEPGLDTLVRLDLTPVDPQEPRRELRVRSWPADASLFLEGRGVGATPFFDRLAPGSSFTVRLEKEGFEPWERDVSFAEANLLLEAKLRPQKVAQAQLELSASVPARVFIGPEERGTTPLALTLPSGGHEVVVEALKPPSVRASFRISLEAGEILQRKVVFASDGSYNVE